MQTPENSSPAKKEREQALALERRRILNLTPEKVLDAIMEHPFPVTLVQSFAEEDLHLLVHAIGPDDALPVLALSSNDQWDYLLDMETWTRDHMEIGAMTQWLGRLLKADPDRFTHWIVNEKADEISCYLFRNIEVLVREYEQDPAELGDDYISEDQTHFYRLRPLPQTNEVEKQIGEERDALVVDLLKRLAVYDYPKYISLLLGSSVVLPAETEEELYRLRNVRLAEKGLLPFEDAVGVYQPLEPGELFHRSRKPPQGAGGRSLEAVDLPFGATPPPDANAFVRALSQIKDDHLLRRLQTEFAGLCNQVVSADQRIIRERKALDEVVAKTSNTISIGLEAAAAVANEGSPYFHAHLLQTYMLGDLFRVGYGRALALKWRVDRWRRESWFARAGLPLGFWGETWLGVLGGLLLKKPLFFDNYASGTLYREFASSEDIVRSSTAIDRISAFDDLLALLKIDPTNLGRSGFVTYKNLLLTLWANHHLAMADHPQTPAPLSREQFRRLFHDLWVEEGGTRKINDAIKTHFLEWLSERSGLKAIDITSRMGAALDDLFNDIETELGSVDPRYLDPRFIFLFLFKKDDVEDL